MIELRYTGRFGNQMFQYAAARILSKEKKEYLYVQNNCDYPIAKEFENFDLNSSEQTYETKKEYNQITVGGFKLDYEQLINHDGKIFLYGYFQDYENFLPHKNYVKSLYSFQKKKEFYQDDLLAIHIRLGDYFDQGCSLDIDYYIDVIKTSKKLPVIYTDDIQSPYIKELKEKLDCPIVSNSCWEDFVELASYKHICISQSSYSWWAAWLSNAETIYYPLNSTNYWQHRGDGDDVNLIVVDENRYIFV